MIQPMPLEPSNAPQEPHATVLIQSLIQPSALTQKNALPSPPLLMERTPLPMSASSPNTVMLPVSPGMLLPSRLWHAPIQHQPPSAHQLKKMTQPTKIESSNAPPEPS